MESMSLLDCGGRSSRVCRLRLGPDPLFRVSVLVLALLLCFSIRCFVSRAMQGYKRLWRLQ